MNKEDYDNRMQEIEKQFQTEKIKLYKDYAFSNNPYKVGDIITDHYQTIRINKMQPTVGFNKYPAYIYIGSRLKKDLTPFKSGETGRIYQGNIKN